MSIAAILLLQQTMKLVNDRRAEELRHHDHDAPDHTVAAADSPPRTYRRVAEGVYETDEAST